MWTMHHMPKRRSECLNRKRPCPWVRCTHHFIWLLWDRLRDKSDDEIADCISRIRYSCVLDTVDNHGQMTLEQIGQLLNLTRERIRQIEKKAITRARKPTIRRAPILARLKDMVKSTNR